MTILYIFYIKNLAFQHNGEVSLENWKNWIHLQEELAEHNFRISSTVLAGGAQYEVRNHQNALCNTNKSFLIPATEYPYFYY